ncbi:hypothetical protein LY13_000190 [Prauserella aidingensis]|uniref:response regulator receiver protein n=1 Tax=Prauserella aidingensis TaxID=387890 RepID=UPI0020A288F4|nr:response regulator receiver protein [Prauserella aidingensis]MCP2251462.1 hypothetical protein [Prauserella aidingensis]
MSAESVTVHVTDPQAARCGFRHCRQPLPPPGPRGGRPYEFCPDRRWPDNKTCKQLAAAEHALRTALGDTDPPTALRDATDTFAEASRQALEPLQTLGSALEDVTARMQEELTAAATRADEADAAAEQARQAQAEAEERAAEAQRLRDEAIAEADRARADADEAQDTAQQATSAAEAAALAQARAEATAEATAERARTAEDQNKVTRARVDELTERLDQLRGQLAQRTGERDTAQAALEEHRTRSRDLEQSLTERLTAATTQLDDAREAQAEASRREQELARRLDEVTAEQRRAEQDIDGVRAELAEVRADAERLRARAADADERCSAVDTVLHRVHATVLEHTDDPVTLREHVLRELLAREGAPEAGSSDADGS